MDLSYILNELGEERENYFNAIAPPIIQTSNFKFNTVEDFRAALADEYKGNLYSRGFNPTIDILRKKLAALDGAEDALVFSSGIAAITVPILALLQSGDEVVCVENPYSWTIKLFKEFLPKYGVTTTFIDGTDLSQFEKAITNKTKLIYLESPNTFSFDVQDLEAVAKIAKGKGILTMIDNSYCSPLYQQPIAYGIDLVAQSATKYLAGHSDVVAGVLTGKKDLLEKIFNKEYLNIGAALAPQNAWLLLRGLRTLPIRLEKISETADKVIAYLNSHSKIEKVLHPFSKDNKDLVLAKKQMKKCGGLFSIVLKDSKLTKIETFCNGLKHILMAVSWGGYESLIIPACAGISKTDFDAANNRHVLIRIYVGLEEAEYIIADLEQALSKI
ncbi:aminotransferase class I/II-fold pyridoxal phosphate-dependent enzyme [Pedobacter polaris]|uniref:Aminotransferase class I/II-fold pyridoxal phosphate-dependent enzyme n=1 Tax=Pedobacter polaris TaxID=2571273 RepID=A0A4U1CN48_9SPHI|nr:aminotransferase class I/II-fold pyridoxal phosphate-dependent enzyme [Pedobacter polaris]TKC08103.1 aminotransferase class I/II-fold pyridoxal phosphate-dependent enzyme [Pedobacter polaris]